MSIQIGNVEQLFEVVSSGDLGLGVERILPPHHPTRALPVQLDSPLGLSSRLLGHLIPSVFSVQSQRLRWDLGCLRGCCRGCCRATFDVFGPAAWVPAQDRGQQLRGHISLARLALRRASQASYAGVPRAGLRRIT